MRSLPGHGQDWQWGLSRSLKRLPWPCQQGSNVPCPSGITQLQVLGLRPGAAQLSPDPSPPAPAWKEEAREDLLVGLWPAWREEKASGPGDLRNLWLFLAWPAAHRQVGTAELGHAPRASCTTAVPELLYCNRSWGRVGSGHSSAGDMGRGAQSSPVPGCASTVCPDRMGSARSQLTEQRKRDARGRRLSSCRSPVVLGDLWLSPGETGRPHCPPRAGKGCSVWLVHPVRTTSSSSPTT